MTAPTPEPGWYRADGDPPDTHRYWDGEAWVGEPQPLPPQVDVPELGLGRPLASPGQRILGRLIDGAIILMVVFLVRSIVDDDITSAPSRTASLAGLVFGVAYEVGMVAGLGATVGKLVVGTRIVTPGGVTPPGTNAAVLRWLPNAVSIVPLVGPLIAMAIILASLIWLFTDRRRRTIFDRAASTYVVTIR